MSIPIELGANEVTCMDTTDARTLAHAYIDQAIAVAERVRATQLDTMHRVAKRCADTIHRGDLVHLFGTGHSRMAVEEVFPRYGSFPGFHPIVELSMTHHTQVVGANGQRQAMWIERQEGLAEVILANFAFRTGDVMMVFSTSGTNAVVVEVAQIAKRNGMQVVAVIAAEYARQLPATHSSGQKLSDVADDVIDNGALPGDAMIDVPGVDGRVGPGSTIGNTVVVNAMKVMTAAYLAELGDPPTVLSSAYEIGAEASRARFEAAYDEYRRRVKVVYGD